jgi:UDP-glucose 4-epimerase
MEFGSKNFETILGDVRDEATVANALKDIDFVFHAAALKQVPFSEENPMEYVKTNIVGSHNLLRSLIKSEVKNAVFLSTDKAVYPINAMGMTKSLMEKLVRSSSYAGNSINCITRYGNVIGSRGSIIPYIVNQIKQNLPVKITDWNMTRFMMTLEDAVDLVLYAFNNANQGDLFIQKAPSASIRTLAQALIELYKSSSEIKVIGTRHGEKLYETLVNREDMTKAEDLGEYYRIPADNRDLNYEQYFSEGIPDIANLIEYHSHNTTILDVEEMKKLLLRLPIIRKDILGDVDAIQYPY